MRRNRKRGLGKRTQTVRRIVEDPRYRETLLRRAKRRRVETKESDSDGSSDSSDNSAYYFNSYSRYGIHEEMLKDRQRTGTYEKAIKDNPELFRGKTVLDVGCGTGIFCLFAADAGAKHVYGVDFADIANAAKQIIEENNKSDRITIIHSKIEEVELPVDKVDIIVSEWMGYMLLYESMVDTLIFARDKWLVEGGILLPDHARITVCALECDEERLEARIGFWDDPHQLGYTMSSIKEQAIQEPAIDRVASDHNIISNLEIIKEFDLYTATVDELDFETNITLIFNRDAQVHAFVCWFDAQFTRCKPPRGREVLQLSTSPRAPQTHWRQVMFFLDPVIQAEYNKALQVNIKVQKNKTYHRDLDIQFETLTHSGVRGQHMYYLR